MSTTRSQQQAAEYAVPYHHLPHVGPSGRARLGRNMRGGMEYLAYVLAVRDVVAARRPASVLDVGCGDGRLLAELEGIVDIRRGVDLDARAVAFAEAFAPGAVVTAEPVQAVTDRFDLVTCVETIEHVPDEQVDDVLAATAARVAPGGWLVLTVPSTARPVLAKHYRHYDVAAVEALVERLPGRWVIERLEEIVRHRPRREHLLRALSNRLWTLDLPWWNRRVLRDQRRPVPAGRRGLHVLAVLERLA